MTNPQKRHQAQRYLQDTAHPIILPLVSKLLSSRPTAQDLPQFCLGFIIELSDIIAPASSNTISSQEEEADSVDTKKEIAKKIDKRKIREYENVGRASGRVGISSEVYPSGNPITVKKSNFQKARKSSGTVDHLKTMLKNCFLFSSLSEDGIEQIINVMETLNVKQGESIVKEGETGDSLFLVEKGNFDCFKFIDKKLTHLKVYKPGDIFGELTILYGTPRQATIIAKTEGKLYMVDRYSFTKITREITHNKRAKYMEVLQKMEILQGCTSTEKQKIADVLKQRTLKTGQYVFEEGQEGSEFYFVLEGILIAEKNGKQVFSYQAGDYFGEISLLKNSARQASIKAISPCKVAYLDRESFKRLLGGLEERLRKNQSKYSKYLN